MPLSAVAVKGARPGPRAHKLGDAVIVKANKVETKRVPIGASEPSKTTYALAL
jgi:hypothetical protein